MEDIGVPENITKKSKITHNEQTDLVYHQLPTNFIPEATRQLTQEESFKFVETYVKQSIAKPKQRQSIYRQFAESFVSLDNPAPTPVDPKVELEKKMQNRKIMPAKERRSKQVFNIPEDKRIYSLYLPLHILWKQYISDSLAGSTGISLDSKLVKTDFHGGIIKVVRTKCPNLIGITGIVLMESENTFSIITEKNELKVIPKANSVFNVQLELVPPQIVTIYGNNFCYRSYERSAKKFKTRAPIEL